MKMGKSQKTVTCIENSEKLFRLSHKEIFKRLYALEMIFQHLEYAGTDARKKERLRSKVALKTIAGFLEIGRKEYDQRGYSRFVPDSA